MSPHLTSSKPQTSQAPQRSARRNLANEFQNETGRKYVEGQILVTFDDQAKEVNSQVGYGSQIGSSDTMLIANSSKQPISIPETNTKNSEYDMLEKKASVEIMSTNKQNEVQMFRVVEAENETGTRFANTLAFNSLLSTA